MEHDGSGQSGHTDIDHSRRRVLAASGIAVAGSVGLAGCLGRGAGDPFDDYGPQAAPLGSTAVSWDDLGDLEGELVIYNGRTRDQIDPLFEMIEEEYPDFSLRVDHDGNEDQLNKLVQEGDTSPADVFYTQSSGALAALKSDGFARELPEDIVGAVDDDKSDPDGEWTGASGRVRAIMYDTDVFDGEDLPDDIFAYAEEERFQDVISTRPNSGTFRSFITAMIEMEGEDATREWVSNMVNQQNATLYSSGSQQAEEVAYGDQDIGLGNQYYAGRILSEDPDASLDVAFTSDDPGCLFNVSGVAILEASDRPNLAAEFTRHVLAAEGQEFFVDVNGEYPVVDGVEYVGDLPTVDDINPPSFDLNALADLEPANDLLREEGMTV